MGMLLVTLAVMLIVVIAMSVGVLFGRQPIKGSCGGVGKALAEPDYQCEICGGDEAKCEAAQQSGDGSDLAFDATEKQDR